MLQLNPRLGPMSALHAQGVRGDVPEWVHLVPAGRVDTVDDRGPFQIGDPAKLITASMEMGGGKLPIDENHATDLAAPQGGASPARGWIVELAARADGIWGRVEWTEAGRQLVADGAYRGISPVLLQRKKDGAVIAVLRAALTNTPNLRGLTALHHQENGMNLLQQLRQALGLKDTDDDAVILNSVAQLKSGTASGALLVKMRTALGLKDDAEETAVLNAAQQLRGWNAMRTSLVAIAKVAGLKEDADATAILNAVTSLAASAESGSASAEAVTALQSELAAVTTKLATLEGSRAKDLATAFVDGEIAKGRVGVKPLRDHYIAQHAVDPARVEKEIKALPILGPGGSIVPATPPVKDGKVSLNAEQQNAAKLLGINPDDYAKTLAAERAAAEQETI